MEVGLADGLAGRDCKLQRLHMQHHQELNLLLLARTCAPAAAASAPPPLLLLTRTAPDATARPAPGRGIGQRIIEQGSPYSAPLMACTHGNGDARRALAA